MNKKIVEYHLINRERSSDLIIEINKFIKLGWQPFVAIFHSETYGKSFLFRQSMVKYED